MLIHELPRISSEYVLTYILSTALPLEPFAVLDFVSTVVVSIVVIVVVLLLLILTLLLLIFNILPIGRVICLGTGRPHGTRDGKSDDSSNSPKKE